MGKIKRISIYGFCDDRGTNAYNLWLSKKRANAVKQYFTDNEFSEDIITVIDKLSTIFVLSERFIDLELILQLYLQC